MKKAKCRTYFAIRGDFNLEEISEILGIKNTAGYLKGAQRKYGKGVYEWSLWEYGTGEEESMDGYEQAERIIDVLLPKIDKLLYIKRNFDCNFVLQQVPIATNRDVPALGYKKKVIDFCSKTNTNIDIDLYVN